MESKSMFYYLLFFQMLVYSSCVSVYSITALKKGENNPINKPYIDAIIAVYHEPIRGYVIDDKSGNPIPNAEVTMETSLLGKKATCYTDSLGKYQLDLFAGDDFVNTLTVVKGGYKKKVFRLKLKEHGVSVKLLIALKEQGIPPRE